MRERFFKWLARIVYGRAGAVFILFTVLTAVAGGFAEKLRMDMSWNAMVPEDHPTVETYEAVIENFGAATQIIIALEGDDTDALIEAAEALEPALESVEYVVPASDPAHAGERQKAVKRVDVGYDTEFIAEHGLMLIKRKALEKNRIIYTDYNLVPYLRHTNDVLETEYVQDSDNLAKQEKEAVQGLDGKEVSLSDYKGKVLLIDFWASWCGPCKVTIPIFNELHKEFGDTGLTVIGLDVWDQEEMMKKAIADLKIEYTVLYAPRGESIVDLQYGVEGIPTAYLIDKEGIIRGGWIGSNPAREEEIRKALADLGVK